MSNQKVRKLVTILPQLKDVFVEFAKFQNVRDVPQKVREDYFNNNLSYIAQKFAPYYGDKSIQDFSAEQFVTDLMEWLEAPGVQFKIAQKKQEPKEVKRPSVSPKPVRTSNDKSQAVQMSASQKNKINQKKRPTTPQKLQGVQQFNTINQHRQIKKDQRQRQYLGQQGHTQISYEKTKQFEWKQTWIKLSQCLQYPQKRFYIFPDMRKQHKKY